MASPRVLTITFKLRVPEGLRANIQGKRLETAVGRIIGAVHGLVPVVFPWADQMKVSYDWSYRWWDDTETIELPPTEQNTVDVPANADEIEKAVTA